MIALLAGILTLVLLGQATVEILRALPPRLEYVGQDKVVAQGWPVEWTVTIRVRSELIVATFYSEREQMRLVDELKRRR